MRRFLRDQISVMSARDKGNISSGGFLSLSIVLFLISYLVLKLKDLPFVIISILFVMNCYPYVLMVLFGTGSRRACSPICAEPVIRRLRLSLFPLSSQTLVTGCAFVAWSSSTRALVDRRPLIPKPRFISCPVLRSWTSSSLEVRSHGVGNCCMVTIISCQLLVIRLHLSYNLYAGLGTLLQVYPRNIALQ